MLRRFSLWCSAPTCLGLGLRAISKLLRQKAIQQLAEILLDCIDVAKLGECPCPIGAEIVDAGNPQGAHCVRLQLGIQAAVAFASSTRFKNSPPPRLTRTRKSGLYRPSDAIGDAP
jgi:hypothetical protein